MIERAEATRDIASKRALLDIRKEQYKQSKEVIQNTYDEITARERYIHLLEQQARDLEEEANDVLLIFCQSYFYNTLQECPDKIKPIYEPGLEKLLIRITRARQLNVEFVKLGEPTQRTLYIKNKNTMDNCTDVKACPVNYMKHNKEFTYQVSCSY